MAEVKNSFIQSKMNKDLDDRLIPNGEYRDALNISVGKAEDKDVGAIEAVLGNQLMVTLGNQNLKCIGQAVDNQNNRIFQFWTDYTDQSPTDLTPPSNSSVVDMRITMYTANGSSGTLVTLVFGKFLNFATNPTFQITGANVLENLLFWTDNRNQPRKINITKAASNPSYYTTETQISVAKYYPLYPISVFADKKVTATSNGVIPTSPPGNPKSISFTVSNADALKLHVGLQLINSTFGIDDYAVITKVDISATSPFTGTITLSIPTTLVITTGQVLSFYGTTMTNQTDNPLWSGDPNFLKDRYVRFSYRYKFDDGEYSLMAPFTQILFVPNQNGYFLNEDENTAYRSTVLSWMENYINNIVLEIYLPDTGNNIANSYKIISMDILYKESDSNATKVIETVPLNDIALIAGNTTSYTYSYKSTRPYKTLPENQTVRVYDKVPIRAKAQDVVGNRIVYGNIISQSTAPLNLDYNLAIVRKSTPYESWAEYPNHTLKQNRNYQVGFILADKFGRQSSVILSSNDLAVPATNLTPKFVGSTIYSPYFSETDNFNIKTWRGNSLALILNKVIASNRNEGAGTPGLYAQVGGAVNNVDGFEITAGIVTGNTYTYTLAALPAQGNYPEFGNYLRGEYIDYVRVTVASLGSLTANGPISSIYNFVPAGQNIKYSYNKNPLGWYSYKIVVRQQQQEYYNVYLPGMLNDYPMWQTTSAPGTFPTASANPTIFPTGEINKTAHTVLLNDNINKIPRDLAEIGPDQKQYRSSVELFGRVQNGLFGTTTFNRQYYPSKKADVASTIASSADLKFLPTNNPTNLYGTASNNFYQLSTTPIIARISTNNAIGVIGTNAASYSAPNVNNTMNPFLSIYETAPVTSLLELFWESSTAGLISDLNLALLQVSNAATGFDSFAYIHREWQKYDGVDITPGAQNSPFVTNYFQPVNAAGGLMTTTESITMTVKDQTGANRTSNFELIGPSAFKYAIKIKNPFTFLIDASSKESYEFTFNLVDSTNGNSTLVKNGFLSNSVPEVYVPIAPYPIPPFYDVIIDNPPLIGPVYQCYGSNGAPSWATPLPAQPNFNQQQIHWEILSTSTPANYATYFDIDASTGVVNLINASVPAEIQYILKIRLRDVYNFTLTTPGLDSLYIDTELHLIRFSANTICQTWTSETTYSNYQSTYINSISGLFNFWKMFNPGETIDIANSDVRITDYETYFPGTGEYFSAPYSLPTTPFYSANNLGKLTFNLYSFYGNFQFSNFQGDDTIYKYPVYLFNVSGNIRALPSGRNITINFQSVATFFQDGGTEIHSTANDCNVGSPPYISATAKSWRLTNSGSSSIIWNALAFGSPQTVIGGSLAPGLSVGSVSVYGGNETCIHQFSLSFGSGGIAVYSAC